MLDDQWIPKFIDSTKLHVQKWGNAEAYYQQLWLSKPTLVDSNLNSHELVKVIIDSTKCEGLW